MGLPWLKEGGNEQLPRMERAELELHKEHWLHVKRQLPKAPKPLGATAHTPCCSSHPEI